MEGLVEVSRWLLALLLAYIMIAPLWRASQATMEWAAAVAMGRLRLQVIGGSGYRLWAAMFRDLPLVTGGQEAGNWLWLWATGYGCGCGCGGQLAMCVCLFGGVAR